MMERLQIVKMIKSIRRNDSIQYIKTDIKWKKWKKENNKKENVSHKCNLRILLFELLKLAYIWKSYR